MPQYDGIQYTSPAVWPAPAASTAPSATLRAPFEGTAKVAGMRRATVDPARVSSSGPAAPGPRATAATSRRIASTIHTDHASCFSRIGIECAAAEPWNAAVFPGLCAEDSSPVELGLYVASTYAGDLLPVGGERWSASGADALAGTPSSVTSSYNPFTPHGGVSSTPLEGGLLMTPEVWDAKHERKLLDLEISNRSLVAINTALESTKVKQTKELRVLREQVLVRNLAGPSGEEDTSASVPETHANVGEQGATGHAPSDLPAQVARVLAQYDAELGGLHWRCRSMIDALLETGRTAILSRPAEDMPMRSKVLHPSELETSADDGASDDSRESRETRGPVEPLPAGQQARTATDSASTGALREHESNSAGGDTTEGDVSETSSYAGSTMDVTEESGVSPAAPQVGGAWTAVPLAPGKTTPAQTRLHHDDARAHVPVDTTAADISVD
ncbi:hypothetical protein MSPP1_001480 [Malassezia sp. CBS 17886]|nr:hypothetical protein MSPP1_001480 [Malassezia sp. CBS 17886]